MMPPDRDVRCPACGAAEKQERLGPLGHTQSVVYHCRACGKIYAGPEDKPREVEKGK